MSENKSTATTKLVSKYLTITLPDGTKKKLKFEGATEEEAIKKREHTKKEIEMGRMVFNSNTIFRHWAEMYLETYKKPKLQPDNYRDTQTLMERMFTRHIGHLRMSEIKTSHLQNCINVLEGKSKPYIRKCIQLIKGVFEKAKLDDMIFRNPALGIEAPRGVNGKRRALTEAEKNAFFEVAEKHSKGLFFSVMIGCGLRPGEVRALTWSNVNMKNCTITVVATTTRHNRNLKGPKSDAGNRTIPMPDWLVNMFKKHPKGESIFVFPGKDNRPMSEHRYLRCWKSFLRLMDLEGGAQQYRNQVIIHSLIIGWDVLTPYYLRHTYATGLAEAGVDIKTAQYLLGHADIKMTAEIYTHVTNRMLDSAREKINSHYRAYGQ